MFQINATVSTNVGLIRQNNEDNFSLFGKYKEDTSINEMTVSASGDSLCAVAALFDGMGGEDAGEIASYSAASELEPVAAPADGDDINDLITKQIRSLNDKVCRTIIEAGGTRMGTTFVGTFFVNDKVICANVGDSRGFIIRNGKIKQLSHDHSEGQRMVDMGLMTEEEARQSRKWHVLSQCLGVFPEEFIISPYLSEEIDLRSGDRFLLCTDGLTDLMTNEEIEKYIIGTENEAAVSALISAALSAGGRDNVTVMIIDII